MQGALRPGAFSRVGTMSCVTELGIVYQKRPEHGVSKTNKEDELLAPNSGLLSKSLVFFEENCAGSSR